MTRCVIIVAKQPLAGLSKTRLAAGIGSDNAVMLYRCFLQDTIASAARVPDCRLAFSFWPPEAAEYFQRLDTSALLLPQHGDDFGSRLLSAFVQAAAAGYDEMVLIGSDNPSLPLASLMQAFEALQKTPTVLGPCEDGGYYMIGMREPQPALFLSGISWSTDIVADQTRMAASASGLGMAEMLVWYDIDTTADLIRLYDDLRNDVSATTAPMTRAHLDAMAHNGFAALLHSDVRPFHLTPTPIAV